MTSPIHDDSLVPSSSTPAIPTLLARAMRRLRTGTAAAGAGGLALTGAAALQLPLAAACVDDPELGSAEQADWAQFEGQRNTSMVSFTGDHWSVCRQPNTRFGCGSIDVFVKLRVKPVAGADLAWKRVGVVYHTPDDLSERTAVGYYVGSNGSDEEWHVVMNVPTWQTTVLFDSWYQDGAGHTFLDDNQGELHVVNEGPDYQVIRMEPWTSTVTVTDDGVQGTLSMQIADLDYDKGIELVASKDGWQTVIRLGMGSAGDHNAWYWVEDFPWSPGRERWQIDLDLPGGADAFEYAVVYRHGVVNGARTYEFWDNNGGHNYRVDKQTPGPT